MFERFRKKIRSINIDALEKRAETKTLAGLFENGWLCETEDAAWDAVREEAEDTGYGGDAGDAGDARSQVFYKDFSEVKDEIESAAVSRLFPPTPWTLEANGTAAGGILQMRNQPTGDCVGNGYARAIETLLLDLRAQKYEVQPRAVHPSYIYGGARMLAGARRGAGANVALAAKFVFDSGVLFENTPGVKRYSEDTNMSDRLGRRWDSAEFKELMQAAAAFRVTVIKLPSKDNLNAINTCLDAGCKIAGGFRQKFAAGEFRSGVKFGRLSGSWNHCVSILGRFTDPTAGYIWGNSHGNRYPGSCVLGTPAWALNLSPSDTERMCSGASLYAVSFVQIGTNKSAADWRPMPVVS